MLSEKMSSLKGYITVAFLYVFLRHARPYISFLLSNLANNGNGML